MGRPAEATRARRGGGPVDPPRWTAAGGEGDGVAVEV